MSEFENEMNNVHDLLLSCMNTAVLKVEADTKLLCPVRTGNLKRSYTHDVEDKKSLIIGSVGTNVEYAFFADLKRPHLTQAIDMNRNDIENEFRQILSRG